MDRLHKTDNYKTTKANDLPDIKPDKKLNPGADELGDGGRVVTVIQPNA